MTDDEPKGVEAMELFDSFPAPIKDALRNVAFGYDHDNMIRIQQHMYAYGVASTVRRIQEIDNAFKQELNRFYATVKLNIRI